MTPDLTAIRQLVAAARERLYQATHVLLAQPEMEFDGPFALAASAKRDVPALCDAVDTLAGEVARLQKRLKWQTQQTVELRCFSGCMGNMRYNWGKSDWVCGACGLTLADALKMVDEYEETA